MNYTITINPENHDRFLTLNPRTFAFRHTVSRQLNKVRVGDRVVVYVAQKMVWAGVYRVSRESYKSDELLYPGETQYVVRLEVEPIVEPDDAHYVEIKTPELWNQLERFEGVNHKKSGWIYNAQLAASLCQLSDADTQAIINYLKRPASDSR